MAELERVALFRDEKRYDGWRQFGDEQHEANTREAEYEVGDFVRISDLRVALDSTRTQSTIREVLLNDAIHGAWERAEEISQALADELLGGDDG